MKNIRFYTIENELYYKGKVVLKYTIEYPEVIKINNVTTDEEVNSINKNIRKDILKIKNLFENEVYSKTCNEISHKMCNNSFYLKNNEDTYNLYCLCNLFKENNKYKIKIDIEIKSNQ